MLLEERELVEQAAHIDALLAEIERFPDLAVRDQVAEIIQGLLGLYGEGLNRIVRIAEAHEHCNHHPGVLQSLVADDLISHLLLLHDLHPQDVESRVLQALEEVRPYLKSHGGNVELVRVEDNVAYIRLQGSCNGCPSSTMTLKLAIEEAVRKAAPELDRIEAEGVATPQAQPVAFLPMSELRGTRNRSGNTWTDVPQLPDLPIGHMQSTLVSGTPVLFINLEETLLAYRDTCPDCHRPLADGSLRASELTCSGCGHRFDVERAGRSLDSPHLYMQPVPLLVQQNTVKVALNGT